jgi:hypothetical protein
VGPASITCVGLIVLGIVMAILRIPGSSIPIEIGSQGLIEHALKHQEEADSSGRSDLAADRLEWDISNGSQDQIAVTFFSQNSPSVWLGLNHSFPVKSGARHSISLACTPGELICFGAWVGGKNKEWGIGYQGRNWCEDCCSYCGSGTISTMVVD